MDKYVELEAVKAEVRKRLNNPAIIGWLIRIVDAVPAADVAPVVRCKDCKWFADNNGGEWYGCWLFNGIFHGQSDIPTSDDFCSYGERKDGDD